MQGAGQARTTSKRPRPPSTTLHRRPPRRARPGGAGPRLPRGLRARAARAKRAALQAQGLRGPAEPRRLPAQPRRVRGGAQGPAPGRGDPPQERARPLLPGRHRRRAPATRRGALKALRSAIAASPANRAQARSDSDFDPIRDDEEFVELVYPGYEPPPRAQRPRRVSSGRLPAALLRSRGSPRSRVLASNGVTTDPSAARRPSSWPPARARA